MQQKIILSKRKERFNKTLYQQTEHKILIFLFILIWIILGFVLL